MKAPSADRKVLILLAGIVWSLVGIGLMIAASVWVLRASHGMVIAVIVGIVAGIIIFRFGFSKLVQKNITRIYGQSPDKNKICIFAFQNIRSYFLVIVMMLMGYTLRHLPIPKIYLSPVYLSIGLALFMASFKYYVSVISEGPIIPG